MRNFTLEIEFKNSISLKGRKKKKSGKKCETYLKVESCRRKKGENHPFSREQRAFRSLNLSNCRVRTEYIR